MAKQTINIGSSANKGDGDPLRTAFTKVNNNFTELYDRAVNTDAQTLTLTGDALSISGGNSVDLSKYVDSTFSGDYDDLTNKPTIPADVSDLTDNTNLLSSGGAANIGDVIGSVFADDSTLLVDGVAGKIVGDVETARLRTSETTIALGSGAGLTTQGIRAVAIGDEAGQSDQGVRAVAIGYYAGQTNQRTSAVAIGDEAGRTDQGIRAVAIGYLAGGTNQGNGAVAIGDEAGRTNQAVNSIVINATGSILDNTVADTFVVKPVRNVSSFDGGGNFLHYNTTSGEISHSAIDWGSVVGTAIQANGLPVLPTQTLDISGSVFADDSTLLVDGVSGTIPASVINGVLDYNTVPIEYLRLPEPGLLVMTPTPTSTGSKGQVIYSAGFVYICVATNTWVRAAAETAWE